MRTLNWMCQAVLLVVLVCGTSFTMAGPIDLSGRQVLFQVKDDGELSGASIDGEILSAGSTVQLEFELPTASESHTFALLVPGKSETTVTANGNVINLMPVERTDSLVFMIGGRYLRPGANTVQIERQTPGSWAGIAMFSVADGFEQVHFHQVFGEQASSGSTMSTRDIPPAPTLSNYDVQWYDCTWVPSMTSAYMQSGSQVIMGARATVDNLQTVDMDFDMNPNGNGGSPMTIDRVDSGPGTEILSCVPLPDVNSPRIRITLPAAVDSGEDFIIRIQYHGAPNDAFPRELFGTNPLYARTHNGIPVVYSVSQAYGGRRWWPSKDQPSDKATTSIQRIIVPDTFGYTLTAVSNGVLEDNIDHGATREYVWRNDHPIATYLMSMAVSNYEYHGGTYTARDGESTMPVGSYIYPEDADFEGNGYLGTIQVMNFYADTFGEYPFLDQKYVTAAWNISWAIEHQTCTSMPGGSTAGLADGLTRRNVHELAHQWFGDKITMASWDHLWLNEGFATYCEALFFEHYSGKNAFHNIVNSWSPSFDTPVVGPDTDQFGDGVAYKRGAWVLHMLRFVLGDEKFFQALRDWAASGYTTALSQPAVGAPIDFQSAVEQSAGLAPGAMEPFFTQWLYSPNASYEARPDFSFSAAYDLSTSSVAVQIKQVQSLQPFQMPVEIKLTAADNSTTNVRIAAGVSQTSIPLGNFVPVSAEMDPDNWVLDRRRASINTASLPDALLGSSYSFVLQGESGIGISSWQRLSGTAPWISVSASGNITGTPSAAGVYPVQVRLTDNWSNSIDASFDVVVVAGEPLPAVVINEVLGVNWDDAGDADYVELLNTDTAPVAIGNWTVVLVDSSGAAASIVTIPGGTTLQPGEYFVIGNSTTINAVYPGAVDMNTGWANAIPDGTPGGIVLKNQLGQRIDSLAYRSDRQFGGGSEASDVLAEGGTGYGLSSSITNTATNVTMGRLPNGVDTGSNLQDFAMIPASPGAANSAGVTLPFFDDFNGGASTSWKPAFQRPLRVATPLQAAKPNKVSPAGGDVLEVFDSTGGGDAVYLPGAFDKLNVEGYIWIPQDMNDAPWSTGIGIGTRMESAWFSSTAGFGLENGFYLDYQNGSGVGLKNGIIPDAAGQIRLLAIDASQCPGIGLSSAVAATLGSPVTPAVESWQKFRLFMDRPGSRLYAEIGDNVIYDGAIPEGGYNLSGGVAIGFRENHSGNPSSASREGTWVDDIKVDTNTNTGSGVEDFALY